MMNDMRKDRTRPHGEANAVQQHVDVQPRDNVSVACQTRALPKQGGQQRKSCGCGCPKCVLICRCPRRYPIVPLLEATFRIETTSRFDTALRLVILVIRRLLLFFFVFFFHPTGR